MSFNTLLTSTSIPAQWTAAVDSERVPQAVLLAGSTGAEILPLALKLVEYLQCSDRKPGVEGGFGESCGICDSCRSHKKLTHPDVHFTFPVVGTGVTSANMLPQWREEILANPYLDHSAWLRAQTKDNKQGNINRDEVMRILHDVSLQRFTDGYKVVMIWGAEYLGDESNRLLKVIEEPPAKTLILLLTTRFERILPTITSRCRIYRLPPAPTAGIANLLEQRGLDHDRALQLAYAADGDIGRAIASAAHQATEQTVDLATWLRECFAGKGAPITQSAVKLATLTREEQKHFLLNALRFVRELGVACAGTPQPLRLAPSDAQVANKLAALVTWPQLTALADELNRLLAAVERNANGKIAFAATSIRIHHILTRQHSEPKPVRRVS
ncbi:MAG: ATP-binding protein [Saprospiraceae bacterium]